MQRIRFAVPVVLACLLATISVFAAGEPESDLIVSHFQLYKESEKQARKREEIQAFLAAIPLRMVFPEGELKTYVIDPQSGETLRRFDGALQQYRPDLDVILTMSERQFYNVDGKETDTLPEKYDPEEVPFRPETVLTLWKFSTGGKIGEWKHAGDMDDTRFYFLNDNVLLWNARTKKTDVINMANGEMTESLPGSFAYAVFENSKATLLLLRSAGGLVVYDPETFRQKFMIPGDDSKLSNDRSRIVTWSSALQDATVFELSTGRRINSFPKGRDVFLNRDGTKLLTRDVPRKEIALWDVDSGRQLWTAPFGGVNSGNYTFEFSDDDRIITGDYNFSFSFSDDYPQIFVWNGWNGKEIAVFKYFDMRQYIPAANRMFGDVKQSPLATKATLCDAVTGEKIADGMAYRFEAASRDGKTFLTSVDGMTFLWDSETGNLIRSFRDENVVMNISETEFDSNPALIKTTMPVSRIDSPFATRVTLLDIETGNFVQQYETLPYARHGDITWKNDDENAVFWNLATGEAFLNIRRLPPEGYRFAPNVIGQIHFTPDGLLLISIEQAPWERRVIF